MILKSATTHALQGVVHAFLNALSIFTEKFSSSGIKAIGIYDPQLCLGSYTSFITF